MNWKSLLKADSTDWLLERENPSVRYSTLVDIMDCGEKDTAVKKVRREIMTSGAVPRILEKQNEDGSWGVPDDFYMRSKYKGSVWNIILLAQLGVNGNDAHIRKAAEFILAKSQDRQNGGFAYRAGKNGGYHSSIIPCLTGNMVFSLLRFGYLDDARVQQGIEWLTKYQRFDDRIKVAPEGWPYERQQCYGKHTCTMGIVKALKALAEIPEEKRTPTVRDTLNAGAEYLLKHHLYKRSHNLLQTAKPSWTQFSFPLMWNTDVMEMLDTLVKLGYRDNRMHDAIDLMLSKQDDEGRWTMGKSFNHRFLVSIEKDGKPSKWLTLNTLRILKNMG